MILILISLIFPSLTLAINCPGCTPLDTVTFDKMVNAFPVSLIKFDIAYPYGEKHEEFAKVAVDGSDVQKLFVGEVNIKDYGDRDNEDLAERFKILKEDLPVIMLFKKDSTGGLEELRYRESIFDSEAIKTFVRQKTGIYLPLVGCIESFDRLADKMMSAKLGKWESIMMEAEDLAQELEQGSKDRARADTYVKIMRKMVNEGESFAKKEFERTQKMLETKITEAKRLELKEKLNVLKSFERTRVRDEL